MFAISIGRIAALSVGLAAFGAALFFGIAYMRQEPPVESRIATSAPAVALAAPGARPEEAAAGLTTPAEVNAVTGALAVTLPSPDADGAVPVFDVARIEPSGDAVIAGRVAPGATVELLRNGELVDRAVADPSGQFVMVPPKLPSGDYGLTLRSTQPNGERATSRQTVMVALGAVASNPGAARSGAEMPTDVPKPVAPGRSVLLEAARSSQARLQPDAGAPSADVGPAITTATTPATAVVSRGDSLWRISRITYGEGMRYAFVYKANRGQIRNPDRIYPGQIIVLPMKAR